jgi:hypothetical protein
MKSHSRFRFLSAPNQPELLIMKTAPIFCRIRPELKKALQQAARDNHRSVGGQICQWLADYLDQKRSRNPGARRRK